MVRVVAAAPLRALAVLRRSGGTQMVLADPQGSILTHYIETEVSADVGFGLEGIGGNFLPPLLILAIPRRPIPFQTVRPLL